jgi:superfamily II DNA or RNA helicase
VAHRKVLQQAKATFQGVLKDNNFGDLWVDGLKIKYLWVQTLNNRLKTSPEILRFDEVHHISASLDYLTN